MVEIMPLPTVVGSEVGTTDGMKIVLLVYVVELRSEASTDTALLQLPSFEVLLL